MDVQDKLDLYRYLKNYKYIRGTFLYLKDGVLTKLEQEFKVEASIMVQERIYIIPEILPQYIPSHHLQGCLVSTTKHKILDCFYIHYEDFPVWNRTMSILKEDRIDMATFEFF